MNEDIKDVEIIKGSIETQLEFIRKVYDADIAAIFLVIKEMHEDEKLFWFERRLKYIKEKYDRKGTPMPDVINRYWEAYKIRQEKEDIRPYLNEIEVLKFCFKEAQKENPSINIDTSREPKGRLWKYTYKQRPAKWVIFNNYTNSKREDSILGEGLTAYAVRTSQTILIPASTEMKKYPCLTHLNAREEPKVTPECKMAVFFPIRSEDEKIIGLLKIENYSDIPERYEWFDENTKLGRSKKEKIQQQYLPLLIEFIEESKKFSEEFSYEKLYGVSPRLFLAQFKKFKRSSSLTEVQKGVLEKTKHLLWVLERKEYVGHKEIMLRVTNYADDIAEDISISIGKFFKELLEERKKHEDLMLYETEGYRDHFMHSFHVFLIGYIILDYIGLDNIQDSLNAYLKSTPVPYNQLELNSDSVLKIWFLTAFLHDAAYVFERFDKGIDNFTRKEWGYSLKILQDRLPLLDIVDKKLPFSRYLGEMLEFFTCRKGTNRSEMLPHYLDAVRKNDHGVLSALWLLGKFEKRKEGIQQLENYLSALAISFHNPIIFKHLKEESQLKIHFESFPIPFLLAFCDTAAIWGRRTKEMEKDVKIQLVNIELSAPKIILSIFYAGEMQPSIDVQDKDHYFKSSNYQFEIKFFGGDKWTQSKAVKLIVTKSFY